MRLLKVLVAVGVVLFLALTGFAYLGDMRPESREVTTPVAAPTTQEAGNGG
jgi:hypothetical protein